MMKFNRDEYVYDEENRCFGTIIGWKGGAYRIRDDNGKIAMVAAENVRKVKKVRLRNFGDND